MKKFSYDFSIEAIDENEAETKVKALGTLASGLTTQELSKLAHIVKHDPVKTALAKRYLKV
ncbi:hypothetical protein [Dinghuibacter silviterrae]|uniref:Uncharacterized protein n=1 Tax=Dinghuibacter silviterrae TaxID=1539049 RepID=A0A4R8DU94_9BACT|nr:hypothetical protein [Dinghuibacter silviterrae]TDX01486.1 hypothetical protein EDB95_2522 [Dinghuibacter silviterrae]